MSEQGIFKKSWSYVVTGVTCAVVGVGVTLGANVAKIQDTITKAEANKILLASAAYSAEYAVNAMKLLPTSANKQEAVTMAIQATTRAAEDIIKTATATKEIVKDAADEIKKKDAVEQTKTEEVKKVEEKTTEVTKNATEATKKEAEATQKTTEATKETVTPSKETTKVIKNEQTTVATK